MDLEPLFHYVVIRHDLADGVREAQVVHAAGESGASYAHRTSHGLPPGTRSVVLACRDEAELHGIAARLEAAQARFSAILESEGDHAGQLMALGLEPIPREDSARKCLSNLPLYRRMPP